MTSQPENYEHLLQKFDAIHHELRTFMNGICDFIGNHPDLIIPGKEIIHSYKKRIKDRVHLKDKIHRKILSGTEINSNNLFNKITDLAGVRFMHLFQEDFKHIHRIIERRVEEGDWILAEKPKAYTWDPESAAFFGDFNLDVIQKPTSYTSVHYLIRPRSDSPLCCEVQVRTLFEEIWGEVDHRINYPAPSQSLACKEQIKVLSKIVGAGSRLLDSLNRVHEQSVKPV